MFDLVYNFPVTNWVRHSSPHDAGLPREKREVVLTSKPAHSISGTQFIYDYELNRTFVEFLHPDTGEVVIRFPYLTSYTNGRNF